MKKLIFCLFLLFISASMAASTVLGSTTKSTSEKKIAIIYIGNSITFGCGHQHPELTAPPVIASSLIQKKLKTEVIWRNCGVSGATTYDFLPSYKRYFPEVEKAIKEIQGLSNQPIIFSIMLGTNDSACTATTGAPVSNANYKKNLLTIINHLRKLVPNSSFILHRPIWYSPNTYNGAMYLKEGLERMIGYTPVLQEIASENADIYMGDEEAFDFFKENYTKYQCPEDGNAGTFYLHPNEKGSAKLAKYWVKRIIDVINK